jgi:16S rRNA (guanine527-N7)-methyltransferase
MLDRHLIDSLSIAEFIQGDNLIDVGTGPGLPGIPLAILWPEKKFHLLDSNGKKTRFLNQAKSELALSNITVVNQRVEQFRPELEFDAVLSRAFASLEDMLEGTAHLCKKDGYFFAMKGVFPEIELQGIKKPYKVQPIQWLTDDVERHLVSIQNS